MDSSTIMKIKKYTKFFIDTEFDENGETIVPISLGAIRLDRNNAYYAVSSEFNPKKCNPWVQENVLPYLFSNVKIGQATFSTNGAKTKAYIRDTFLKYVKENTKKGTAPQFWGYYADYDWIVICQLFGRMVDLPEFFPKMCMDIKQEAIRLGDPELPEITGIEHNSLADAVWTRTAYNYLLRVDIEQKRGY